MNKNNNNLNFKKQDFKNCFPDGLSYKKLYKRTFGKNSDYILTFIKGPKVLDLCGGTGYFTEKLKKKGFDVTYVDKTEKMCLLDNSYKKLFVSVENYIKADHPQFNDVVCIKSINCWFNTVNMKKLSSLIRQNGRFIFDTFNGDLKREGKKTYILDNNYYSEINYVINRKIFHSQIIADKNHNIINQHNVSFDWIRLDDFVNKLVPYFNLNIRVNNNSTLFICTKK